ncbi:hypothetical protein DSO57_1037810 [Entomophthora muscae]|uniref:Uncharacterized protein n=1 Tax=Entomophthora muscae TaxID=34485 RepID=A0ACC2U9N0_9FUNG|nr:hypothetical protein DSO57_1037810 [Entomophthora muscae]
MNEEFTAPPPPDQAGIGVYNNPLRKRPVEPNNPTGGSRPFKLRKPTERTFSEKLTQIIPESKLYNELLETEKDWTQSCCVRDWNVKMPEGNLHEFIGLSVFLSPTLHQISLDSTLMGQVITLSVLLLGS